MMLFSKCQVLQVYVLGFEEKHIAFALSVYLFFLEERHPFCTFFAFSGFNV